jgi:endoglucanase
MLDRHDPMAARFKTLLYGMNQWIPRHEITPPLTVDAGTGDVSGVSPPGFSAALLPYFSAMENRHALHLQSDRLTAHQVDGLIGEDPRYYDQVLALFGQGWMAHYFIFSSQGQLVVQWNSSCSAKK